MLKAGKSLDFSTPPLFEASAWGNPLEFYDEIWQQKTRIVGLPDTIPVCDRRTDRRMDRHVALAKTRASIASRGKN